MRTHLQVSDDGFHNLYEWARQSDHSVPVHTAFWIMLRTLYYVQDVGLTVHTKKEWALANPYKVNAKKHLEANSLARKKSKLMNAEV